MAQTNDPKTPSAEQHNGVHPTAPGESIRSRSADPGQSSYGGFSNEDPSQQAQQLADAEAGDGEMDGEGSGDGDGD